MNRYILFNILGIAADVPGYYVSQNVTQSFNKSDIGSKLYSDVFQTEIKIDIEKNGKADELCNTMIPSSPIPPKNSNCWQWWTPPEDGVVSPESPTPPRGCDYAPCEAAVCECDDYCCNMAWDLSCRGHTTSYNDAINSNYFVDGCSAKILCCEPDSAFPDLPAVGFIAMAAEPSTDSPYKCTPGTDDCCETMTPPSFLPPDDSSCWKWWDPPTDGILELGMLPPSTGCDYQPCQDAVCACDSYCCEMAWDISCRGYSLDSSNNDSIKNNLLVNDLCSAKVLCCEPDSAFPDPVSIGGLQESPTSDKKSSKTSLPESSEKGIYLNEKKTEKNSKSSKKDEMSIVSPTPMIVTASTIQPVAIKESPKVAKEVKVTATSVTKQSKNSKIDAKMVTVSKESNGKNEVKIVKTTVSKDAKKEETNGNEKNAGKGKEMKISFGKLKINTKSETQKLANKVKSSAKATKFPKYEDEKKKSKDTNKTSDAKDKSSKDKSSKDISKSKVSKASTKTELKTPYDEKKVKDDKVKIDSKDKGVKGSEEKNKKKYDINPTSKPVSRAPTPAPSIFKNPAPINYATPMLIFYGKGKESYDIEYYSKGDKGKGKKSKSYDTEYVSKSSGKGKGKKSKFYDIEYVSKSSNEGKGKKSKSYDSEYDSKISKAKNHSSKKSSKAYDLETLLHMNINIAKPKAKGSKTVIINVGESEKQSITKGLKADAKGKIAIYKTDNLEKANKKNVLPKGDKSKGDKGTEKVAKSTSIKNMLPKDNKSSKGDKGTEKNTKITTTSKNASKAETKGKVAIHKTEIILEKAKNIPSKNDKLSNDGKAKSHKSKGSKEDKLGKTKSDSASIAGPKGKIAVQKTEYLKKNIQSKDDQLNNEESKDNEIKLGKSVNDTSNGNKSTKSDESTGIKSNTSRSKGSKNDKVGKIKSISKSKSSKSGTEKIDADSAKNKSKEPNNIFSDIEHLKGSKKNRNLRS